MSAPDLGHLAVVLALAFTTYALAASIGGVRWRLGELLESGRNAALGAAVLTSVAVLALLYALLTKDFSVRFVADTTSLATPWEVSITGLWGGQSGSLLFWSWTLALFSAVAVWRTYERHPELAPAVTGVLAALQLFFLFLLTFVSSPFERLPLPPADGRGLNPLLWDDGMRIHPPLLLAGYMSFALPFAFAIAALVKGRLGREWLAAVRPWAILSWAIQGAGLLAGAWWAYHVLGWGGYWGWDPVENAALLPFLTSTAFLHSAMVQERRGMLKVWNLALVITTFCLSIFGTFVVRSGVLSSVHSFALSAIGPFFFVFLGVVVLGSLALVLNRLPLLTGEGEFDSLASREAGFLLNNFLFASIAAATFWGIIFPLISEAARGVKVAVGPPFYQQVNGPLLFVMFILMGIGPLLAWRRTSSSGLWRSLRWPLVAWLATSALLFVIGVRQGLAMLAYGACAFVTASVAVEYWRGVRLRHRNAAEGWLRALTTLVARDRRRYGGYVVHLGIVFIALGIIGSSFFQQEAAVTLRRGESASIGGYSVTYRGLLERNLPDLGIVAAELEVSNGGRFLGSLQPERRVHRGWEQQPITGVAIQTYVPSGDDLYVLLTGWDEAGAATFRLFVNPLVSLIWLGGVVFLVGTVISAWPERHAQRRLVPVLTRTPAMTEV